MHQEIRAFPVFDEIKAFKGETFKDYYVAYALAYLANFGANTVIRHRIPGDHTESARTVFVFHPDEVARFAPGDSELLWAGRPSILVSQLLNNRVHFSIDEEKVKPELLDQIPDELRRAFPDRTLVGRVTRVLDKLFPESDLSPEEIVRYKQIEDLTRTPLP